MFLFLIRYLWRVWMDKSYFVTYNKLVYKSVEELVDIFLGNNTYLSKIAENILIEYDYFFSNTFDNELLLKIVDKLELESVWYLAKYPIDNPIRKVAYDKIMQIIAKEEQQSSSRKLKIIK